jgi:hypothetical protein
METLVASFHMSVSTARLTPLGGWRQTHSWARRHQRIRAPPALGMANRVGFGLYLSPQTTNWTGQQGFSRFLGVEAALVTVTDGSKNRSRPLLPPPSGAYHSLCLAGSGDVPYGCRWSLCGCDKSLVQY